DPGSAPASTASGRLDVDAVAVGRGELLHRLGRRVDQAVDAGLDLDRVDDPLLRPMRMAGPVEGDALWHRREEPASICEGDLAGEERRVRLRVPEQREDAAQVSAAPDH